jgi:hypothetical protein
MACCGMGDKIDNRGIKDGLSAYATLALSMSAQATGSTVRLSNLICGLPGFDPDRTERARVVTEASRASDRGQSLLHPLATPLGTRAAAWRHNDPRRPGVAWRQWVIPVLAT